MGLISYTSASCRRWVLSERRPQQDVHLCRCWSQTPEGKIKCFKIFVHLRRHDLCGAEPSQQLPDLVREDAESQCWRIFWNLAPELKEKFSAPQQNPLCRRRLWPRPTGAASPGMTCLLPRLLAGLWATELKWGSSSQMHRLDVGWCELSFTSQHICK